VSRFILHYIDELTPEERKRLGLGRYETDGSILEDTVTGNTYRDGWEPEDATFMRDLGWVPALLDELGDEIEALKASQGATRSSEVAYCVACGPVEHSDEDGCCLTCGRDLVLLADAHSADMLSEHLRELRPGIIAEIIAEATAGEAKHGPLGTYEGEPIPDVILDEVENGCAEVEARSRRALESRETASVLAILGEEVGEMARAETDEERRAELVQVAAVAIRWIAMIDARKRTAGCGA